jgi:4-amino-4-deoxy-L-arabinose transferase-like glycosyltransferase
MPVSSLSSSSTRRTPHSPAVVVSRGLVLVGTAALLATIVILIAGGFVLDAGPLHLSFRRWLRPAGLSVVAWALCAATASMRHNASAALEGLTDSLARHATSIAVVLSASAAAVGISYGTYAASGSDAAGYIAEAELLAAGQFAYDEPLARLVDWADASASFAPLAFRPVRTPGQLVPTYPPGLSLTIVPARVVAGDFGAFLVAPLLGGIAVLGTYVLGRRLHSPLAGVIAAALLTTSPIFLFEIVQVMSDVPATAWLTLALLFAIGPLPELATWRAILIRAGLAGCAAGMAVLTRPNLLPLVIPLFAAVRLKADPTRTRTAVRLNTDPVKTRTAVAGNTSIRAATGAFIAGLVPGGATLAWLQWRMYGSPLASGYGPTAFRDFFSVSNIGPNIGDYTHRLLIGETPALVLAVVATVTLTMRRRLRENQNASKPHRQDVLLLAAFMATVVLFYLPYGVFPDWWYLRFLLPALPMAFVLVGIAAARASAAASPRLRGLLVLIVLAVVCSCDVVIARDQQAFLLRASEARYQLAGRYLAAYAPANAVVVTVQDSAAMHVYTHLPILRWDLLPIDLDDALTRLRNRGIHPLLLVEEWERPQLRTTFPKSAAARLDWMPIADFGDPVRVGLFDPFNRTAVTDRVH